VPGSWALLEMSSAMHQVEVERSGVGGRDPCPMGRRTAEGTRAEVRGI
jgi:hypothetical protein